MLFPAATEHDVEVIASPDGTERIGAWRMQAPAPGTGELRAVVVPAPVKVWTTVDFIQRLTEAERAAIFGSADATVKAFVTMTADAGELHSDNADFQAPTSP